jgi:signal transduction histidine kinase/ActR/RegA family two-component response regulator
MRVRTTIILLLLLAGTAFVAGLVAMRRVERERFDALAAERALGWRRSVETFLAREGQPLATMVEHLSSLEGAVSAILDGKTAWAAETWDENTLKGYGANAVWVYRRDGSLFHSLANTDHDALRALPPEAVGPLIRRDKPTHFFVELPPGVAGGRRIVEVRGQPVRPSWDAGKEQAPAGFFFAGRLWDAEKLREFPLLPGDDKLTIRPPDYPLPAAGASLMSHAQDWRDWQGRNIAKLVITNSSSALAAIESRADDLFKMLLIGTFALFAILYLVLSRAIVRPLRLVIEALHREDVASLDSMCRRKAEFGELACLIKEFFEQQTTLVREMLERIGTEKALRESEEMLRHSQKMEAVGRLAGGVAHDFNNLLTAIIGYADLLRQRFAGDASARQPAELIHQAGEQAAGLTRQLLAFSRKQLLQPKVIDLNVLITNLHRLLQRIIGEHIEVRATPEALIACVKADPGQVEQVIMNLGVNARDAMPRGGKLTIRTRNLTIEAGATVAELPPGEYVALEVTDTGEGMDEETKARIFEPFFTTKGVGKGTGLGLATVYGIVRQSRGGIVVESQRGQGTTFRILLPREDGPVETASQAPAPSTQAAGGEKILIVEDEEIVRELVCEILRSHGYRVLATDRGSEAVRLVRAAKDGIDLLISDVVMPEMNGAEVARCVQELAPHARVLFVSGYSENDMADQGLGTLAFQVLQKPFTPAALASKVREVLDGSAAAEKG